MDQDNNATITPAIKTLGGKSWTAYTPIVLLGALLLGVVTPLAWLAAWGLGLAILVASVLFLGYKLLLVRSYRLYFDDIGVWVHSGVLPWNKGTSGVKWRDLDEAIYFQSVGSWLFKSYSIRIGHRFTKSSEILLSHMAHGHESVMAINAYHQQLVRDNALH